MVNEVELAGMASERAGTGIARIGNTELGDADGAWLRQGVSIENRLPVSRSRPVCCEP
jgi:hypothetical protein